ncbi:MAG: glycosylase [Clostridia bacterium]|nr:glycosylase [Clostridia bacterium]
MDTGCRWLDKAVFYQIYPQSFKDSDGDGIGDLRGIIEKLDYIRELGCTALWLNPCFESPFLDAGYDVSDYCRIAPRYGTNEDARTLFAEAHRRGLHVLLDLVPGHTSWDHPWFRASMKAAPSEFTDRYVWTGDIWEEPAGYNALRGISERSGSCVVNFFTHQPALNYGFYKPDKPWQQAMDAPGPLATREAMKDVMRFWLDLGCDGFRVDMAGSLVKGDPDGKGTIALWQDIRAFLEREYPAAAMVSEWGEPDKSLEGGFHMDFLLPWGPTHYNDLFRCEKPFFGGEGDASVFVEKYTRSYENTDRRGLICIPSGNHDMDRLARSVHGAGLRLAFAFLLSMPGAPFIYYGDEIGMRYVEGLTSVEGGYGRTGSRSPMQWDASPNAGFSAAEPERLYIPLDPAEDRPTAERQMADPASLWQEVRRLIAVRMAHPALQSKAEINFVCDGKPGRPLAYLRRCAEESVLVMINPTGTAQPAVPAETNGEVLWSDGEGARIADGQWVVGPRSACFVRVAGRQGE